MKRAAIAVALVLLGKAPFVRAQTPNDVTPSPPTAVFPNEDPSPRPSPAPTEAVPTLAPAPAPAPAPAAARATEYEPDPHAAPEPPQLFGTQGQLVVGSELGMSLGYSGYTSSSNRGKFEVRVEPAVSRFMLKNFSLGATLLFDYAVTGSGLGDIKTTSLWFGVTTGYNVPIGKVVSWWPTLGVGVGTAHVVTPGASGATSLTGAAAPGTSQDESWIAASLYLPFLIHPVEHFFVGLGPEAFVDLSHDIAYGEAKRFFVGASSTIGGWF